MDQRIIYIGSIREYLELDKKKTKNPDKYKKFEIVYDLNKIRKEVKKMTNKTDDEKRFSVEELKVNAFLEKNPKMSYREAVLICLDKSEPEIKEVSEEEKQFIEKQFVEKQEGDLRKVEKYIELHPGTSYCDSVLACLSEPEGSAEDQEIVNMYSIIGDIIYNLSRAEKSAIFKTEDKSKLEQASNLVVEVKESLQKLIDKKGKPEPGKEE